MALLPEIVFHSKCVEVLADIRYEHQDLKEFSKQLRSGGAWNINGIQKYIILDQEKQIDKLKFKVAQFGEGLTHLQKVIQIQNIVEDAKNLDEEELEELPESNNVELFRKQAVIALHNLEVERGDFREELQAKENTQAMLQQSVQAQKEELEKLKKELEEAKEFQLKYQRMKRKRNQKRGELEVEQNVSKRLRKELEDSKTIVLED